MDCFVIDLAFFLKVAVNIGLNVDTEIEDIYHCIIRWAGFICYASKFLVSFDKFELLALAVNAFKHSSKEPSLLYEILILMYVVVICVSYYPTNISLINFGRIKWFYCVKKAQEPMEDDGKCGNVVCVDIMFWVFGRKHKF